MSRIDSLKEEFAHMPEVQRIKELENYIDHNPKINEKFSKLKAKQKQMVNAKEFNQINQYKIYLAEYKKLKEELLDMPFVEEYLEALDIVNEELNFVTEGISKELSKALND